MKKLSINLLALSLLAGVTACSFVSLTPEATKVSVVPTVATLGNCKFLGNTNVSIWAKASSLQSQKSAESQLDTLARNEAATMGGNNVVAITPINNGQRSYGVYNCPAQ